MMRNSGLKIVGITGGVGAGKTEILKYTYIKTMNRKKGGINIYK